MTSPPVGTGSGASDPPITLVRRSPIRRSSTPLSASRRTSGPFQEHAGTVLREADIQWYDRCYYVNDIHKRNPYADPTNAADVSGIAPATVVTAGYDPLQDGGKKMRRTARPRRRIRRALRELRRHGPRFHDVPRRRPRS